MQKVCKSSKCTEILKRDMRWHINSLCKRDILSDTSENVLIVVFDILLSSELRLLRWLFQPSFLLYFSLHSLNAKVWVQSNIYFCQECNSSVRWNDFVKIIPFSCYHNGAITSLTQFSLVRNNEVIKRKYSSSRLCVTVVQHFSLAIEFISNTFYCYNSFCVELL